MGLIDDGTPEGLHTPDSDARDAVVRSRHEDLRGRIALGVAHLADGSVSRGRERQTVDLNRVTRRRRRLHVARLRIGHDRDI